MTTAVIEAQDSIITASVSTEYIANGVKDVLYQSSETSTHIVLPTQEYVLVDKETSTVVLAGGIGPPGISEEEIMYSKRIDFISDNELYRGEAAVGSAESSAVWRIRKIVIGNDGDVTETWASGTANFDKVWVNRTLLTYS